GDGLVRMGDEVLGGPPSQRGPAVLRRRVRGTRCDIVSCVGHLDGSGMGGGAEQGQVGTAVLAPELQAPEDLLLYLLGSCDVQCA
uniref:Uncharacterized protein n=1 Tax=Takifugu rubripes TaxID=31033 RepID=A0A674MVX8_TAKRU